jgi:GTPase
MSTTSRVAGSQQSKIRPKPSSKAKSNTPPTSSAQTRQSRLAQLTTQLLWRLQQSSPYHAKGRGELVIPKLPDDGESLELLVKPQRLLPGLEESNGALYEIGVSDDGTFVGLTKNEMDESMTTLKIMAASLGCRVEVQRMKLVGTCEWTEASGAALSSEGARLKADLWVAEALVMSILEPQKDPNGESEDATKQGTSAPIKASRTVQLRISLTGPTTSGKTTLLGTLANGKLDNGRGSSRIDLLKHRHEVVSGQTSSVAQELIGYKDAKIFNYASPTIESWTDIHDHAEDGRLVFFSDSAGHLRFRRTILRGLVGWAPHWTLLCITANGSDAPSHGSHSLSGATDDLGDVTGGIDLAVAHLDLCLQLEIPLVILITKYDLAKKDKLRNTLNMILTKVKATGRTPKLIAPKQADDPALSEIPTASHQKVQEDIIREVAGSDRLLSIIPIILTSAVSGLGIGVVHALLDSLPVPPVPTSRDLMPEVLNPEQPASLFHIDDKYELASHTSDKSAIVVAGYLRFGTLSIGDKVVLGPFPVEDDGEARSLMPRDHPSPSGLSISQPTFAELARFASRKAASATTAKGEWLDATVVHVRNLRLPVRTMEAGQAGTIQIVFDDPVEDLSDVDSLFERSRPAGVIRKGQVLAIPSRHMLDTGLSLQAASGLKAIFKDDRVTLLSVGCLVNVYVATVRAAARILKVIRHLPDADARKLTDDGHEDVFGMEDSLELDKSHLEAGTGFTNNQYIVTLELLANREWVELGSRVVLMEGGKQGSSGLEGYVGNVIEIAE